MRKMKRFSAIALSAAMAISMLPAATPKAADAANYTYLNEYTLGYSGGKVVAYVDGKQTTLADAGVKVFDGQNDNPFEAQVDQAWDEAELVLSQPIKYTTNDGVAHDVESMLTGFDFIADPTAIDNSDVDGKLYVYGTTEGFSWSGGKMADNGYRNHSLTILSTTDMVNWTDEGFMDSQNLTNAPSGATKTPGKFTSGQSWAPSGLKIDGDGDGDDEYYIFFTNGGSVGYVVGDSPMGPWRDPLGKALFTQGSPNCSGVVWCFDPGVLADSKGNAYVYFGGGTNNDKENGKTGRVCKIGFEDGTGNVYMDGTPVVMETYYFFEDSEINEINGKYYYSYCANFNVPNGDEWTKSGSIAVYVGSDPLNIAFNPREKGDQFEDEDGTYHHYLGTILENPSVIYGQSYNNHHHMQTFKDHAYIIYHSTVLNNNLHRSSHSYRNLHVDEITVDEETDEIAITPSYEGAKQIEAFDPYKNFDGSDKYINATTTSYSAGVKSTLSDDMLRDEDVMSSNYFSPMVLDAIDTGDWTKLQGVDLGKKATSIEALISSPTEDAAVEVFLDDPTKAENKVATISGIKAEKEYTTYKADFTKEVSGVHDVYFVFRGAGYTVSTWKFNGEPGTPADTNPTPAPQVTTAPQATTVPQASEAPQTAPVAKAAVKVVGKKTVKVGKTLKLKAKLTNVKGKVKWSVNKKKLATISKAGKLKAKKKGTVVVTAKVGKVKGTLKIKIKK